MANTTENKPQNKNLIVKLLTIACAVLVLAVIVVSAFAYEWHNTIIELKDANMDLRALADPTAITSMSDEIGNLTMQNNMLQSENDAYKKTIAEYEEILLENGLIEE